MRIFSAFEDVFMFRRWAGQDFPAAPTAEISDEMKDLCKRLIDDEINELYQAIEEGDVYHIAKELMDVLYVVIFLGTQLGLTACAAKLWNAVSDSNLAKVRGPGLPILNEWGKVQKPPGWIAPDNLIKEIVDDAIRVRTDFNHRDSKESSTDLDK